MAGRWGLMAVTSAECLVLTGQSGRADADGDLSSVLRKGRVSGGEGGCVGVWVCWCCLEGWGRGVCSARVALIRTSTYSVLDNKQVERTDDPTMEQNNAQNHRRSWRSATE